MDLIAPQEVYLDYLEEQQQIIMEVSIVLIVYINLEQIMHLKDMKDCAIIMTIAV